jgi:hypothetical protein
VHHIDPWHISRSHDESNLAVLCLNCHSDAHTRRDNALNLTPARIKGLKDEWKREVIRLRAQTVAGKIDDVGQHFDYINVPRLFELVALTGVDVRAHPGAYRALVRDGVIDKHGIPRDPAHWGDKGTMRFLGDDHHTIALSLYLGALMRSVVEKLDVTEVSNDMTPWALQNLLNAGQYVVTTGGHYFRPLTKESGGIGQTRAVVRRGHGIRISGQFDAWYSLTSSSYLVHLRGHPAASVIWNIRTIKASNGSLEIEGSCLAIGSAINPTGDKPGIAWLREMEDFDEDD